MRMRNRKWTKPFLEEEHEQLVKDPFSLKGKWASTFGYEKVALEIGFGKGNYIKAMSKLNPDTLFVGLEKDPNCTAICLKSIDEELPNVKLINDDASNLLEIFAEGELDNIYLNFSDPWPKKGHQKRRLSSTQFIDRYDNILKKGGYIIQKTDNRPLFEYSVISFTNYGYKLLELNLDFRCEENEDPITEYEQKFIELDQPIYRMKIQKNN